MTSFGNFVTDLVRVEYVRGKGKRELNTSIYWKGFILATECLTHVTTFLSPLGDRSSDRYRDAYT